MIQQGIICIICMNGRIKLSRMYYYCNFLKFYKMGAHATIHYENSSKYEGQVKQKQHQHSENKQNIPQGKGCFTFSDGSTIQGQFECGRLKFGHFKSQDYTYQGEFNNQEICGVGVLSNSTNHTYQGLFQNGQLKAGKITKRTNRNESVYIFSGEITDLTKMNAKGVLEICLKESKQNQYVIDRRNLSGQFTDGKLNAKGKYQFPNGDSYQGQFKNGNLNGEGSYKSRKAQIKGEYRQNVLHGQATIVFSNKDQYEGEMKDGRMHGTGKYTYSSGTIYEGQFYCGQQWGQCKIKYPQNSVVQAYEGEVSGGTYQGIGVIYYSNGVIFKGFFQNGLKNGFGVLIYGKNKYKCLYLMNKLVGELKQLDDM